MTGLPKVCLLREGKGKSPLPGRGKTRVKVARYKKGRSLSVPISTSSAFFMTKHIVTPLCAYPMGHKRLHARFGCRAGLEQDIFLSVTMDPGREVGKKEARVSQGPKLGQGQGMYLSASCQSFGKLTETAGFVESAESVCDGIVLRGQMPYRVFPIAFRTPDEELSCQCPHSALGATADRQLKRCGVISQEGQAFEQLAVAAHGQNEPQQDVHSW